MKNTNNPLLCDPGTGVCELPGTDTNVDITVQAAQQKPVKLTYFTDPICSACWGIEPQLRRLKLEYGKYLSFDYRMGGLLPDWDYRTGGMSKPADVAQHWEEISVYFDMPIDGDVWIEDPLYSSFPPSIAFKAAQMQDEERAVSFLRSMREKLFLDKKNITRWEHLLSAAKEAGLDINQLEKDFHGKANDLFKEDLELTRQFGVRGFPTIFLSDDAGNRQRIYGIKPYEVFESAIMQMHPGAVKAGFPTDWEFLFGKFPSLTTREFVEFSGESQEAGSVLLQQLAIEERVSRQVVKNGILWRKKESAELLHA